VRRLSKLALVGDKGKLVGWLYRGLVLFNSCIASVIESGLTKPFRTKSVRMVTQATARR
jgi:hypothetical protein